MDHWFNMVFFLDQTGYLYGLVVRYGAPRAEGDPDIIGVKVGHYFKGRLYIRKKAVPLGREDLK